MVNEIRAPRRLDSVKVSFDDEGLIADAGLLLPLTPAARLGLADLVAEKLDLGERAAAAPPSARR